eukprot:CAMPEP_0119413792 /NCGR_PEP_ID=MMETSP1335-20130426/5969_1 /TAXON_ID=259385 /ORGANISM="Chrysoculter rhomboideus, Strain RCC1486" /LENGTH=211 /DNA_ID=CAMNT_0007438619 /DNA_START=18 /DNA_END=653 /DNA_ORIENTATION=+
MGPSASKAPQPLEPLSTRDSEEELIARFGISAIEAAATSSFHEVRPRLFLGSIAAALDPSEVHEQELTHVVNCLHAANARFAEALPPPDQLKRARCPQYTPPSRLEYLSLDLADQPAEQIIDQLPAAVGFIRHALENNERSRVLVHCMAGVSRSATVVAAYIMATERITAARALMEVQLVRCCANPNSGFRSQLLQFEARLEEELAAPRAQ